jgi:ubiquinone biosynthesis O-methyltransferase
MNKSEKFWDSQTKNFDVPNNKMEPTDIKTLETAKKYLKVDDKVLDYGCAAGIQAIEIAGCVKEVHGIDISSKMIEAAKRNAIEHKIENIDFTQAIIFEESLKRESFDVILAFNILLHAGDTQKVIRRINELLKPGGLLISVTACMGEKKTFLSILLYVAVSLMVKIGIVPNMRFFKTSELKDSITNGNFQIVEAESLTYKHITIYSNVAKKISKIDIEKNDH